MKSLVVSFFSSGIPSLPSNRTFLTDWNPVSQTPGTGPSEVAPMICASTQTKTTRSD